MGEGIKIALPGDASPEEMKKLAAAGGVDPEMLKKQAAMAEADALEDEIELVSGTDLVPYKDDAPHCEAFAGTRAIGRQTKHFDVVQMPAWTHGQCIGPACARFKTIGGRPICGKALQDLAGAQVLGLLTGDASGVADIEAEFERWAMPPVEEPEEEASE